MTIALGIVAIGRNEGERLIRCLRSVDPTRRPVVYVDSASTDGSAAKAAAMGVSVVDLDLSRPFTAARARAEGFAALKKLLPEVHVVQFLDGDCELVDGWLAEAQAFLAAHDDVAVVCGRRRERDTGASMFNRIIDEEWNTPIGEAAACGGDALVRVAAYEAVGGFDPRLTAGEEPELCDRLRGAGWRIWRLDAEMTLHDAAMTSWRQWWWRSVRGGFGYAQVWQTTRGRNAPLYGREMTRAVLWAAAIPLLSVLGAAIIPWALLIWPLLFVLQIGRMAMRKGGGKLVAWQSAALVMLAKLPEFQGMVRFVLSRRTTGSAIRYR